MVVDAGGAAQPLRRFEALYGRGFFAAEVVRERPAAVPPKADVYLLADTTGSMTPIIGAVQAGLGTVVSDPAFAGFDVAWGAGNYKDFPIPLPDLLNDRPRAGVHDELLRLPRPHPAGP